MKLIVEKPVLLETQERCLSQREVKEKKNKLIYRTIS